MCECSFAKSVWLCNPKDCSLPGSSVHGIFQARILKWLPLPSPGDLLDPEIEPCLSHLLHWQADSLPMHHLGIPQCQLHKWFKWMVLRLVESHCIQWVREYGLGSYKHALMPGYDIFWVILTNILESLLLVFSFVKGKNSTTLL